MATGNPRYEGKPLLRLLELYVINAIGELSPADGERLKQMTPKLQQTYGVGGSWDAVIAAAMHFPADFPTKIREMWGIARANNAELTPQAFAEMFVDTNIPH